MEKFKRIALGFLAAAIILLAVVIWGLRLALVNIDYFKPEIEYLLTGNESPDIVFSGLRGEMNRFNPVLHIDNLSLNLPDRSQPFFVDRLAVEFDFWGSLREWAPVVREVSGQLEKVELVRDREGRWWADEFEIGAGAGKTPVRDLTRNLAFVPRYLKLRLNRLIIKDESRAVSHQIERIDAQIIYQREKFLLQLSAALPDALGRGILVKSVLGDARSLIYVNTSNLELRPVADLFGIDTWGLQDGALDGEAWFNLSGSRLIAINGDIVIKNGLFQAGTDKPLLAINYHSTFNAFRREAGWDINNKMQRFNLDGRNYRSFHVQLRLENGAQQRVSALVNRLQISAAGGIAEQLLPPAIGGPLSEGRFKGRIENLIVSIDPANPQDLRLRTRVVGLDSVASSKLPGIKNLDVEVLLGGRRARIGLTGRQVSLDFADQLRAPIELDELEVDAALAWRDERLMLAVERASAVNPDLRLTGRMWLEADPNDVPFVFIRAGFGDGVGSSKSKYLPVKILPPKTLAWLDRSIIDGRVPQGDFQFHGRLRDIRKLDDNRAGEFFVDFELDDAEVSFDPKWQTAKNASGRVLFHNVGVEVELDRVSYGQIDTASVRASIAEYASAELKLAVHSVSDAKTAVETWLTTPVGSDFRRPFSNLHDLEGKIHSHVDVSLPLRGAPEPVVKVELEIRDGAARSDNWGLDLSAINGELSIDNRTIRGRQINALFFGDPLTIDVVPEAQSGRTLLNARGLLDSRNLMQRLPDRLQPMIEGRSEWQLRLSFAPRSDAAEGPVLRLNAASDLVGTRLTFPRPFAKTAESARRITADIDFFSEHIETAATFGKAVRSRGRFDIETVDAVRLDQLHVAFASKLQPAKSPGLHLYGYLPYLSLDDWGATLRASGGADPSLLREADLVVDEVRAFGRSLTSVSFEAMQSEQGFFGTIDSAQVKGSFDAPRRAALKLDLEHLRIDKPEQPPRISNLRPQNVGDIDLHSKTLEYHGMRFTDLRLKTRVTDNTLTLENISLKRDQVELAAVGSWRYHPYTESHESTLDMTVQGTRLGEAMSGLGFGNAMRDGTIDFTAALEWPAPLPGFDLEKVTADAKLKIRDGVLNNVEPGSGRFVGLLSLSALPRRLSLDFSDVLIKGMEFDKIDGTYHLQDGELTTRDTKMEGPAASIKISGKTGVIDQTYDQVMRVTPNIRQTLPVIGAVSAGSSVGWGLLLLQNLFKKAIDDAVEVEYRITGSWEDPKIELIKAVDENQRELPTIDR